MAILEHVLNNILYLTRVGPNSTEFGPTFASLAPDSTKFGEFSTAVCPIGAKSTVLGCDRYGTKFRGTAS